MFEASDSWRAASTTASRSPKSNISHCSVSAETVPVSEELRSTSTPATEPGPLECRCPPITAADTCGR
jgi:hypothetical protein